MADTDPANSTSFCHRDVYTVSMGMPIADTRCVAVCGTVVVRNFKCPPLRLVAENDK